MSLSVPFVRSHLLFRTFLHFSLHPLLSLCLCDRPVVLRPPLAAHAATSAVVFPDAELGPFVELQAVQLASTVSNARGDLDMAQNAILLARATALQVCLVRCKKALGI